MKRMLTVSALMFTALLAVGLPQGRLYAMRVYGAPCGQLSGFAAFLQQTHFLPAGDCKVNNAQSGKGGPCVNLASSCNFKNPVSGHQDSGVCTAQGNTCVCVVPN
jgi:hypothetical protein